MKKTSLLICFVMLSLFLAAQETVTLKFTSTTPNGSYYPFDVVNVTNVTRGWTESLVYPDTTMILTSYNALQENIYQDGFISEVYPNPLSGTAYVYFEMWKSGLLNAKVLSINGSVLSEFTEYMDEGVHQIIINMSIPQMAFLVLRTNDNQYIKKIINIDSGTSDNISINKVSDIKRDPRTRDGGEFVVGDVMSYVAISFYGGNVIESQRITKAQYNNELFSLLFNVNINPTIPTITTSVVTNITHNSAIAGGNVVNNGGAIVTERGVCWGTSPNPTASGNHVVASSVGNGSFVCNVTGLLPTTTYYLRAYAINSVGPSYGNEECFTTIIEPPLIVMDSISNITTTSATLYASVLDDGGALVSPRGFCWSTSPNPTINDAHTHNYGGYSPFSFNHNLTGLTYNTTYYVRAYAINSAGTSYSDPMIFSTSGINLPTVSTNEVTSVSYYSAVCGGNVIDNGGGNITARGVCWSTTQNPTITNQHTTNGTGLGSFISTISELTENTIYYVRAYATNTVGTAYGEQKTFITEEILMPTVITEQVSAISFNTAVCGGNVTNDGGGSVTAKGVCWNISPNPTITNQHTVDGSGIGGFISNIGGLNESTTYYVRAYATNEKGTTYGSQVVFETPTPNTWVNGVLPGAFSVSSSQQVYFSQGNLQYKASTYTWRFAANQFDYIGEDNSNISLTYSGWIDLFGWGTGLYPTNWSNNYNEYTAYSEWGNHPISNGGNANNQWRTLDVNEWNYIINSRSTSSGLRYVKARVNGINGIILLPDNWNGALYNFHNANTPGAWFSDNVINLTDWISVFETNGAVFLPSAGYRNLVAYFPNGEMGDYYGGYWSSTRRDTTSRYCMHFDMAGLAAAGFFDPSRGNSVRLVKNVE